jgi:hypothetical protein
VCEAVSDERALAARLDRALDGGAADAELRELASLLLAAAEPTRFELTAAELDEALGRIIRPRPKRRRRPVLAVAATALVAGTAIWLTRAPAIDVQARAAQAVDATFFVVEEVRPARPGAFPTTAISGYVDGGRGRAHSRISTGSGIVAETLLSADGTVERWLRATNTLTIAPSCRELSAACTDLLDPFALYVRALADGRVVSTTAGGTYRLAIARGRIEETVVVDRQSFLPRRIEWRQDGRLFSTTRFLALERQQSPVSADAWTMGEHPAAHVVQLTRAGLPVRVLAVRPGHMTRDLRWLGATYEGKTAKVAEIELTGGRATRISYGRLVVWNYGKVIPPAVIQSRTLPAKLFGIRGGGLVHAYFGPNASVVADASFGDRNVAIVSVGGDKIAAVRAVQLLRRPGSP